MLLTVFSLRWHDVDPSRRSFDPAPARALAEQRIQAVVARRGANWRTTPPKQRDALEESLDRALLAEYGAWASGWRWAASEPGCGGPVRGWCCSRDSLFRGDDPDPHATVERTVAALSEWRQFLVDLAAIFAELGDETTDLPLEDIVERAAARLLPLVVERTGAEDAWYSTFSRVLSWFLESFGRTEPEVRDVVDAVIRGRFASWCAPDDADARDACAELGLAVANAWKHPESRPDALAEWLQTRAQAFLTPPGEYPREPVRRDGHLHFIDTRDRPRDPGRADRMLAALTACRASARRGEPLTFAALASWQALVLGVDEARFRTTDAFAGHGRDRYGLAPDTPQRFAACLAESAPGELRPALRAARVYLDVCFFHPFVDGNARAARLALDHVVTRAGLALHTVEPIFVVARAADDRRGAFSLAWAIEHLLGLPAAP